MRSKIITVILGLCVVCATVHRFEALAAEQVSFNSASVPPTPFKVKQAKKRGIELKPEPGLLLTGELSKPDGSGPFPAVVLLHGCRGIQPYQRQWASELVEWGYVALLVDSYRPRDIVETCTGSTDAYNDVVYVGQARDAHGALTHLQQLPFVDANRIGIVGWPGGAVLEIAAKLGQSEHSEGTFQVAVAFYPMCKGMLSGQFVLPVLVLAGERDDWTPAGYCKQMADAAGGSAQPVMLKIYPGAYHSFDDPDVGELWYYGDVENTEKQPARGATFGYSAKAHEDAQERVSAFLAEHLK